MALLMLDLNRFQEVNDTFGHQRGDQLLQQVGVRLSQTVSAEATVARLGGDEFVVFLPGADEAGVQMVASQLCTVLEEPFLVEDFPFRLRSA
jgi:diguanylate cyclase